MDDRATVAALADRDAAGLRAVADTHGPGLFAYSWTLVRDDRLAGDAVVEALTQAVAAAPRLRNPEALRPWLFALTRNASLRRGRGRGQQAAAGAGAFDADVPPEGLLREPELRLLAWSALGELDAVEREVVELHYRHGLDGHDLAYALGMGAAQCRVQLARAKQQLELQLAARIVARTGRGDCRVLDRMLDGWDGRMPPLLRRRLVWHLQHCADCDRASRRDVRLGLVLDLLPPRAMPEWLPGRVLSAVRRSPADEHARELLVGPVDPDGFPRPVDRVARALGGGTGRAVVLGSTLLVVVAMISSALLLHPVSAERDAPQPTPIAGLVVPSDTAPNGADGHAPTNSARPTTTATPTGPTATRPTGSASTSAGGTAPTGPAATHSAGATTGRVSVPPVTHPATSSAPPPPATSQPPKSSAGPSGT